MSYASKSLVKSMILNFLYSKYLGKQKKLAAIISLNLSISRISEFKRGLYFKTSITVLSRKQKFYINFMISFWSTKISMWSNSIKSLAFWKIWSKKLEQSNWSCQNLVTNSAVLKEKKCLSAIFQYLRW